MPKPQKRWVVEKILRENGWVLLRSGGSHDLWGLPDESVTEPIPRHREVSAGIIGRLIGKLEQVPQSWR